MFRSILIGTCVAAFVTLSNNVEAQKLEKGDNAIDLGAGVGGAHGVGRAASPALYFHFEHALNADVGPGVLGIGAAVGFRQVQYDYWFGDYRRTDIMLGARAAYHWNDWHNVEQLDVYAGVLVGARIVIDNNDYPDGYVDPRVNPFLHDTFVGAKWYFNESFGAFAEFGYGIKNAGAGLTFKF